MVPLKLSLMTL